MHAITFLCLWSPAHAGVDDILEAIKQSEFSFARTSSEVPFFPLAWAQDSYYPKSTFTDVQGVRPDAEVTENTASVGGVFPVSVQKRDMYLVGGDLGIDRIQVSSGPYEDQHILRITPVAAWLHQFGERETVGAFVAPMATEERHNNDVWGVNGFAGVVALHKYSDEFQLLYGGVYQYDYGMHAVYPYLGVLWLPSPRLSVSAVIPWPSIGYLAAPRLLLQVAVAPGGSSWVQRNGQLTSVQTFGSWNLTAGAAYRLHGSLWLSFGGGLAGFRGFTTTGDTLESGFESRHNPVFTLALQFRP